jgi:hypothetical protein
LTSRPSKKIERSLKKIGFIEYNTHHKYLIYFFNGQEILETRLSHGSKDYDDKLLSLMSHQLYLTKKELLKLIDGKMTKDEYNKILKMKGVI